MFYYYYIIFISYLYLGTGGYNPRENRPNLTKWITRVESAFSPFYKEAHQIVEQTADEYNNYINKLN